MLRPFRENHHDLIIADDRSDDSVGREFVFHSAASCPNTWENKAPFPLVLNRSKCPILAQILAQYAQAAINHHGNHQPDATDKDSFGSRYCRLPPRHHYLHSQSQRYRYDGSVARATPSMKRTVKIAA